MITFDYDVLEIRKTGFKDYLKLREHHYLKSDPTFFTNIYKLCDKRDNRNCFPNPLCVLIYSMPTIALTPRNLITNNFFNEPKSKSARAKLVNKNIRCLARIITDPRFLRLGFAYKLITETLHLQNIAMIETITPIEPANALFLKCGFEQIINPTPHWYHRLKLALNNAGIHKSLYNLPQQVQNRIDRLDKGAARLLDNEIYFFLNHFKRYRNMPASLHRTSLILSKMNYPNSYMYWFNPKMRFLSKKTGDLDRREDRERARKDERKRTAKTTAKRQLKDS